MNSVNLLNLPVLSRKENFNLYKIAMWCSKYHLIFIETRTQCAQKLALGMENRSSVTIQDLTKMYDPQVS